MTKAMNTTSGTAPQSERGIFPPVREAPRTAAPARRKRRGDVAGRILEAGWAVLLLSCAGECVCRLFWAVTP